MPMDFVEQQAHARRKTRRLILYFTAAVTTMIGVIYLLLAAVFLGSRHTSLNNVNGLWNPELFAVVSAGTLLIIVIGSLYKIREVAEGGAALATRLGGQLLNPRTNDADERKLLNVVEEMAIAAGIPVPQVYVLQDEEAINAFAAGYSTSDAIIGVTRGCMKLLTRDELQGVIAHEFSHILNGDMRLNMRLIGWVFGILCLTIIGKLLLRTRGRKNPAPIVGLVLIIMGAIGVFFGRLIKSAVSRQREFLADASAVQFTRNPDGIADALKKIGGLEHGARLSTDYAEEASHLFFGNALGESILFSTHPPLKERIRRIDPSFDGKFPRVAIESEAKPPPLRPAPKAGRPPGILGALGGAASAVASVPAANALSQISAPLPEHLARAGGILAALPEAAARAAREPFDANALIFAMLLSSDDTMRTAQLRSLEAQISVVLVQATGKLFAAIAGLERDARLALAAMAMPALRRLTSAQYDVFTRGVQSLIEADRQIDLFEYALQKMVHRHLESRFRPGQKSVVQYYVLKPLVEDSVVLLSALARFGQEDEAQTQTAFRAGATRLGLDPNRVGMLSGDECNLPQIDRALDHLGQASPRLKALVLDACAHTVASDGTLEAREAELLRAIADTLDCPVPPFIGSASG